MMYNSNDNYEQMLETLRKLCLTLAGVFAVGAACNVGRLYIIQTAGDDM